MDWRIKGAIQKVLTYVPRGGDIHYYLQRRGGGLTDFTRECDIKVDDWRLMVGQLRDIGAKVHGGTLLEMGTGWYPTFPICLTLAGASRVYTYDLNRYLKPEMAIALVHRLGEHVPLIARESGRNEGEVRAQQREIAAALDRGASVTEATNGVVVYQAPADASDTKLDDSSVDVVFSNSVLEHVPGPVIEDCLQEAMRILRPSAYVFHSVNCGDHYAYADKRIHQLNYLQYSNASWEKWNNGFLYQNRLRAVDFTEMARRSGFAIVRDTSTAKPERLRQLDSIRVHADFNRYSREQLAITSIDFIGQKPQRA